MRNLNLDVQSARQDLAAFSRREFLCFGAVQGLEGPRRGRLLSHFDNELEYHGVNWTISQGYGGAACDRTCVYAG